MSMNPCVILRFLLSIIMVLSVIPVTLSQDSKKRPSTWAETKARGKGSILIYWYESKPFIFKTDRIEPDGIEYEIMQGFKQYVKDTYHFDLQVVWKEAQSFTNTYALIRDKKLSGTFGSSAFSITTSRQKEIGFSPPYMSDITVLITSQNIPIV